MLIKLKHAVQSSKLQQDVFIIQFCKLKTTFKIFKLFDSHLSARTIPLVTREGRS